MRREDGYVDKKSDGGGCAEDEKERKTEAKVDGHAASRTHAWLEGSKGCLSGEQVRDQSHHVNGGKYA